MHVHIAAGAKKTILIREGDTADEVAGRFSHRYGLKRRDAELVRERIGRQIYAAQRDMYEPGTGNSVVGGGGALASGRHSSDGGRNDGDEDESGNDVISPPLEQKNTSANNNNNNSNEQEAAPDFPSNLTPSQRRLLMMTLGKGVEMHTPWQTPGAHSNTNGYRKATPMDKSTDTTTVSNASLVTPVASSSRASRSSKRRRTPILRMQIDISGTPSSLTVHEGDDVVELAKQFVEKHQLPPKSVNTISNVINNAVKDEKKRSANRRRAGNRRR